MAEGTGRVTPNYGETKNKALHMLIEQFDSYWSETLEAYQSRDGNTVHEEDVTRLKNYLKDMEAYIAYQEKRGTLDLPHSSNMIYAVPPAEPPQREVFQNLFWYDHTLDMFLIRQNIRESQTRNQPQGFHSDDVKRWRKYIQDRVNYFDDFVSVAQPVDLPQSTSPADFHTEDVVDHTPGDSGYISG
ncbi:MAG: hypothetical protein GY703_09550 [Gammaproteobacteria bacterium]|nr:hypothetical protein [Gammaproteobacteria bacterium]